MKALLYGVKPDPAPEPATDNFLLRNLAHTPMKLVDMDEPGFLLPDWVVTKRKQPPKRLWLPQIRTEDGLKATVAAYRLKGWL